MSERRYSDTALASALIAGGATLVRAEPGRRVAFVLSPPDGGDLAAMEAEHFSGRLTVSSRALNDARYSLGRLVRLSREEETTA